MPTAKEYQFLEAGVRCMQLEIVLSFDSIRSPQVLSFGTRLATSVDRLQEVAMFKSKSLAITKKALLNSLNQVSRWSPGEYAIDCFVDVLSVCRTLHECIAYLTKQKEFGMCADWFLLGACLADGRDALLDGPPVVRFKGRSPGQFPAVQRLPTGYPVSDIPSHFGSREWTWTRRQEMEQLLSKLHLQIDLVFPVVRFGESFWEWIEELGDDVRSWDRIEAGMSRLAASLPSPGTHRPPWYGWDEQTFNRNKCIYEQRLAGTKLSQIKLKVNDQAQDRLWGRIEYESGIIYVIEQFCVRTGATLPPPGSSGRSRKNRSSIENAGK